jgi:hypothetical protein
MWSKVEHSASTQLSKFELTCAQRLGLDNRQVRHCIVHQYHQVALGINVEDANAGIPTRKSSLDTTDSR